MEWRGRRVGRRDFFKWVGAGSLLVAVGGFFAAGLRFLFPNVLYEPPTRFSVGKPTDFPLETGTFLEEKRLFVFNMEDGFSAISSICTHLGCNVRFVSREKGFSCPCHGSKFDIAGNVTAGPAPRPLAWYEIRLSHKGDLIVDTRRFVDHTYRLRVA